MTRSWKSVAGVTAATLAAALALAARPAAASTPPAVPGSEGTITVTGSGVVTVEPDLALLNVGVQATAPSGVEAMDAVNVDSNALTEALEAAGIAPEDIQTSGINLWSTTGEDGLVTGYQASLNVSVTIRDIEAVGPTIDAAQAAVGEGFTIGGLSFSFADPESVLEDARVDAVANARTVAQQYADAAGVTLGGVVAIVENPSTPPMPFAREAAPAADMSVAISPGTLDLSVQISVTFQLS